MLELYSYGCIISGGPDLLRGAVRVLLLRGRSGAEKGNLGAGLAFAAPAARVLDACSRHESQLPWRFWWQFT